MLLQSFHPKVENAKYYFYHSISSSGTRCKFENANELFSRELRKFVPRSGMIKMYKKRSSVQRNVVKTMNNKIEALNDNIGKVGVKFLIDKIDTLLKLGQP